MNSYLFLFKLIIKQIKNNFKKKWPIILEKKYFPKFYF